MARRKKCAKPEKKSNGSGNILDLVRELWQAAVSLRGSIEPADYKRYVLPLIFLRFLSLRYERRRTEIESMIDDPESEYFTTKKDVAESILEDPDEYRRAQVFMVPEKATWDYLRNKAQA